MIRKINSETPRLTVGLTHHGLLRALDLLRKKPNWSTLLSQTDIFNKFSSQNPPEGTRLADFLKKVAVPLGIPFYVLWVWMCTDFSIEENQDPFTAAENYLKSKLTAEEYQQVTQNEGQLNFRKALRLRRKVLSLTLGQMAKRVGVIRDKIAVLERKENGNSMPRCDSLNAVLPFYELHPLELYVLALSKEDPYPNSS